MASSVLFSLGTLVFKNVRRPQELWFAAFPVLFALQQLLEGFHRLAFISVWCFFAAVLSLTLYVFLRKLHHERFA